MTISRTRSNNPKSAPQGMPAIDYSRPPRMVDRINETIAHVMASDPKVHVIGEDLLDPYGGAFKVSKGLSTAFPERVWTSPISEAGIVGVATGLALRGYPAIVELMFGDFTALAFDQLLNHAAKFRWMYDDQVSLPLIVRAPMGGRRGYGPTHSQSIEKHFCGVPDLGVVALHQYLDPATVYLEALAAGRPCLIIENKILYARALQKPETLGTDDEADLVIVSYGGCLEHCAKAAAVLAEQEEVIARIVPVMHLSPFPSQELRDRVGACRRVLVVEEGTPGWGFAAACAQALIGRVDRFESLCGPDHPIPASRAWEDALLPAQDHVVAAALKVFEG